jgi:hypothetical protein
MKHQLWLPYPKRLCECSYAPRYMCNDFARMLHSNPVSSRTGFNPNVRAGSQIFALIRQNVAINTALSMPGSWAQWGSKR